jgi:hypothetical protein
MGSAVLTNSIATLVYEFAPTTNYDSAQGLGLKTASGADAYGLIYFPRPFPLGSTILSAKIKFYNAYAMGAGTHTFTFQRLNQSFSASKVTWNTRPTSLIAGTKSATKSGSVAISTEWEIDVADWMQSISSGGVNYGMRIISVESTSRTIYSEIHPLAQYRPRLEVTWSDAPSTPSGLSPSGGRAVGVAKPIVRSTYVDVSGATSLQAIQVQLNTSDVWNAVAPGPIFDTGTVLTSTPEVDLSLPFAHTVSGTTTNTSTNITGAAGAFETADIGQPITGTGIQASTTITAVAAGGASATLSLAATTSATNTMTITRTYAGLADGSTIFWRVRLQDAAGLWSAYSAAVSFKRDIKGTLAITNPPSGTPTVEDTTPPIIWTFSGETQAAYQIYVEHITNGAKVTDWNSGKVTSTVTSVTVPAGKITSPSTTYNVTVRIWDNKQREATPNDPTYVELARDFTFVPGATTGTTGLTAVAADPRPQVTLTWQRTTTPDAFNIVRNSKVIQGGIDPTTVFVSGTTYSWVDNSPSPGRVLTYSVQAVVNGIASASNATAPVTVRSSGIWLREPVSGLELCIMGNSDRDFTLGEESAVLQPIAAYANKVAINQSLGGLEGRIEGELVSIYGKTAQEWRDQFLQMRAQRVKKFWLTVGDATFQVVAQKFSYTSRGVPENVFRVGFDVYQQDDIANVLPLGS